MRSSKIDIRNILYLIFVNKIKYINAIEIFLKLNNLIDIYIFQLEEKNVDKNKSSSQKKFLFLINKI